MAILSKIFVGACAIASFVQAAPVVLTVTDLVTVTTWTTIELNATTTVWASSGEAPAATTASEIEQTSSAVSVVPIQALVTPVLPSTTTSSSLVAQQPAPTTTSTTTVAPVPTTTTTTTTQAPIPVTTQPPTTLQTFTTTTTQSSQPAVAVATTPASTSSSGGPCVGSGSACTGDITHWDGGLGACGWNVNTATDMQVALPVGLMGSLSNSNPYCGKSLSIKNPISGAIIQATVGDKCMGCEGDSIDLTDILFTTVTSGTGNGRVSGVEWWFN